MSASVIGMWNRSDKKAVPLPHHGRSDATTTSLTKEAVKFSFTMADKTVERRRPAKQGVLGLASAILNGRHPASQLIPLALLAIDAVLCVLVIQKVPCRYHAEIRLTVRQS